MTSPLFPKTVKLITQSQHQRELTKYSAWLSAQHYNSHPIHRHVFRLNQVFLRMQAVEGSYIFDLSDLNAVFDYAGGPTYSRNEGNAVRRAYARFLHDHGRLREQPTGDHFDALCADYIAYLKEVRGFARSTRVNHEHTVKDILERCVGSPDQLGALSLDEVERFILLRSREVSRDSMQHVIAHVRAFLRYCHDQNLLFTRLDDAIETPRTYRAALPPRAMPWSGVQYLLRSIDRRSKAGWRDYCILHLMAHYGLRPIEVAMLKLDSVNWESCVLYVTQRKTRSSLVLPLAPESIQVLQDYLHKERHQQSRTHLNLFLRARCPNGPLLAYGICDIFDKRMRSTRMRNQGFSVYSLRHSFAMRLHSQGVGIKAIGDVLGHRSIETTCNYLRLDVAALREVALDIPGSTSSGGGRHVNL